MGFVGGCFDSLYYLSPVVCMVELSNGDDTAVNHCSQLTANCNDGRVSWSK